MAVERVLRPLCRPSTLRSSSRLPSTCNQCRLQSTAVATTQQSTADGHELENTSLGLSTSSESQTSSFNPRARAQSRRRELPPSRYQFRPPKYYRGPLHPHQPPAVSDPSSRLFQPGPFSLPRLQQTYDSTMAADLMTLAYQHFPPGYEAPAKNARLRAWEGSSPYFKNRPLRGPRGADALRLLRKPITFRNVPALEKVTIHTMVSGAKDNSAHLHVAGMVLQAISGVRATSHATKKSNASFDIRAGQYLSATVEMKGEDMYHFLGKVIDVVMPKIKDWRGVKGSSGDNSGNIAFGLSGEEVALFPEIEVNYDAYPPRMIPGCHVIVHTTARNDRDARLLLSSIGVPFYGKLVN